MEVMSSKSTVIRFLYSVMFRELHEACVMVEQQVREQKKKKKGGGGG
jgi:hypothetical protein